MDVVLPTLAIVAILATLMLQLYSFGVRGQIEKMAPDYAREIYRDGAEIFFARGIPVRVTALLVVPTPESVRGDIRIMRVIAMVIVASTLGVVVALVINYLAGMRAGA